MSISKSIIKKNKGGVFLTALLGILSSLAMVFAGYSLSFLFGGYESSSDRMSQLIRDCITVFCIWVLALVVYYLFGIARANLLRTLKNDLRQAIAKRIISVDYEEFVSKDSGHYVSWLTNDVENITNQSFSTLFSLIENLFTALFSLCALFYLSVYIGGAAIILFFFVSILPQIATKGLQKANKERSQAQEISLEGFKDTVMGFPIFLVANMAPTLAKRISKYSQKVEKENFVFAKRNLSVQVFIMAMSVMGQVILLAVTLLTAIWGIAPISAVLSVGNLAGSFFNSISGVAQGITTLKVSHVLWDKFETPQIAEDSAVRIQKTGALTLSDVDFYYGDRHILQIDRMQFCECGKYALLGESGSGKTTLAKLLAGFLRNYSGSIRYGDIELRQIAKESLYDNIAYVDQKAYLFQDTIRYNITLGKDYPEERILEIVEQCRLTSYIQTLPFGLDTPIAEDGKDMSGGQRQRIALARALIRNVAFVILDESTASLDETNALDIELSLITNPTIGVIFITHNLREEVKTKLDRVYEL